MAVMEPDDVRSRSDFVAFLQQLAIDIDEGESEEIENRSTSRFLDGMAAWISDTGAYQDWRGEPVASDASWRLFAQAVFGGIDYE